jgi:sirohydrochlorin ferrochelatase
MKSAILLVDHGSRRVEANELLIRVAAEVRKRRPDEIVEIAHMEFARPSITEGLARCVEAGAQRIVVHPYFLGPGRHTQESIPELLAESASAHPGIDIQIAEPLGLHPGLIEAVLDRVDEAS